MDARLCLRRCALGLPDRHTPPPASAESAALPHRRSPGSSRASAAHACDAGMCVGRTASPYASAHGLPNTQYRAQSRNWRTTTTDFANLEVGSSETVSSVSIMSLSSTPQRQISRPFSGGAPGPRVMRDWAFRCDPRLSAEPRDTARASTSTRSGLLRPVARADDP
jgi:hypothetical protein